MDSRYTLFLSAAAAMALGIGESEGVRIVRPLRSRLHEGDLPGDYNIGPSQGAFASLSSKRGPRATLIKRGPSGRHRSKRHARVLKTGSLSLVTAPSIEKRAKRARRITRLHKTSRR